jgi:hypothetical protein
VIFPALVYVLYVIVESARDVPFARINFADTRALFSKVDGQVNTICPTNTATNPNLS